MQQSVDLEQRLKVLLKELTKEDSILKEDALEYLRYYISIPPERFAVIKVGGDCIESSLGSIGRCIGGLHSLGLYPVILHGFGNEVTRRLESRGITKETDDDGDRKTSAEMMDEVIYPTSIIFSHLLELVINSYGANARVIPYTDVFRSVPKQIANPKTGERNGIIVNVHTSPIKGAIKDGYIPILSPISVDNGSTFYNQNADTASMALVETFNSSKYIMLTSKRGILSKCQETISVVRIPDDYDELVREGIVTGGMKTKLDVAREAVLRNHSLVVQITNPENLIKELFAKEGVGTYVKMIM